MSILRRAMLAATAGLVLLTTVVVTQAPASAATSCATAWGSLPKQGGNVGGANLTATRTGRHQCWDRVVFDVFGLNDEFRVEYANEVYTEGEGRPLSPVTAGGALLKVVIGATVVDGDGNVTYPHRPGDHVANVAGYKTLRDVVYGGSFEGQTTFAVGVRARLPFRVFVLGSDSGGVRIVLDIAHRW